MLPRSTPLALGQALHGPRRDEVLPFGRGLGEGHGRPATDLGGCASETLRGGQEAGEGSRRHNGCVRVCS